MNVNGQDLSSFDYMASGEWYLAGDNPEVEGTRWRSQQLMREFNNTIDPEVARACTRQWFGACPDSVEIIAPAFVEFGRNTFLGEKVYINAKVTILDCAPVHIGDRSLLGPDVRLITVGHPVYDVEMRRAGWEQARPITIEEDVWIGAGVTVLPGVTIGARSVIGAGAVVSRDIPADSVAYGVPARVAGPRTQPEKYERSALPEGMPIDPSGSTAE